MDTNPTVYLAGPIQHAGDYGKGWRAYVKDTFDGYDWICPVELEDPTEADRLGGTKELVEEEIDVIVDDADGMLVHWEEVPTCGTPMEMVYAHLNDVPTVVQTTVPKDEWSAFMSYHSDHIAETLDEAEHALRGLMEVTTK